jgi:hypothetical protein
LSARTVSPANSLRRATTTRPALRRYEQAHRPLVVDKQQIGPKIRLMVPRSRFGIATRNAVARVGLPGLGARLEQAAQEKRTDALPDHEPATRDWR